MDLSTLCVLTIDQAHGDLRENRIHNARGDQDLAVGNRDRPSAFDGLIEFLDEHLHAVVHMKVAPEESFYIVPRITAVRAGIDKGDQEKTQITLVARVAKRDEHSVRAICD